MGKGKALTPKELRAEAERRLARQKPRKPRLPRDERLLHELEVHQIELELQNEELREASAELEASLERYTGLFDFAPVGYAILASDGTIREVNHEGAGLLGKPRSRIIGQPFEAFLGGSFRSPFALLLLKVLDRETNESCEVSLAKRGEVPLEIHVVACALTRDEERRVLLAFEDITERRQREELRERAERAVREMDRRKDEFIGALSHELRNPLAAIRMSLSLLAHPGPSSERTERAHAIIDRQTSLLTRLVDDLLDATRIARGKIQLRHEVVDLEPLVRRSIEDHRPRFEASAIQLEARLARGPFCVDADAARLTQALGNLLTNAEKFTPRGGVVVVSLERRGRAEIVLRVRDTGAGIAPEILPHVFESFVQAPQTLERSQGGLGLGLAMVKGLVELHGGTVTVASDGAGRGTEVTMRLPAVEARAAAATAPARLPEVVPRRVLVIDDNADNAEALEFGLELSGHEVAVARDGQAGLELARRFQPDVVVSDIGLPGMDGYAVARAFRADDALRKVYLIALSGYTRAEDRERGASAGFDRYLGKPVTLEDLDAVIGQAPVTEMPRPPLEAPPSPLH
jgi:two-component system CheB/CheR fusion protein